MEQQGLWFGARLVCYPQGLQGGEEGEPWVSLSQGEVMWWQKGAAEEGVWEHPMPGAVAVPAAHREGWRNKPWADPSLQECLAGPELLTQPCWICCRGKNSK